MCMQNDNSILTDDNSSNGFCECPTQQMVAISSGSGVSTTEIRPFILVEDPHYMEQMCVPVVTYNESCLYDSQCKATDWSLFCKQIVREDGLATSDMMCDCMNGYEWATDNMLIKKCLAVPDEALNGSKVSAENGTTVEGTFDQETSSGERDLVIWWIFRPTGSTGNFQLCIKLRFIKNLFFHRFPTRIIQTRTLLLQLAILHSDKLCLCFSSFCYYIAGNSDNFNFAVLLSAKVDPIKAVPAKANFV